MRYEESSGARFSNVSEERWALLMGSPQVHIMAVISLAVTVKSDSRQPSVDSPSTLDDATRHERSTTAF